jgi:hypothetical protein
MEGGVLFTLVLALFRALHSMLPVKEQVIKRKNASDFETFFAIIKNLNPGVQSVKQSGSEVFKRTPPCCL